MKTSIQVIQLLLGLALLAPPAAPAVPPTSYKIEPLLAKGDIVGASSIRDQFGFEVDGLTDNGQLLFVAYASDRETLWQYADGKFASILRPGQPAPTSATGKWPHGDIWSPVSMNQSGNAVFAFFNWDGGVWLGTF